MALSRSPLAEEVSTVAMMRSISSVERMSGSWRPNLGDRMNSAGEFSILSEIIRKLKKLLTPLNARACEVFSRPRSKSQAMYRSIICGSTFCGGTSHMRRMKCAKDRRSRM